MLAFQILFRAVMAVARHWHFALLVGLPWVILYAVAMLPRRYFILDAAPPDPLAFHFPPLLPYPYAQYVYIGGLVLLLVFGSISFAIGWHRTILDNRKTIVSAMTSQPRLRYFLRGLGVMIIAFIFSIAVGYPVGSWMRDYALEPSALENSPDSNWERISLFNYYQEYFFRYLVALFSTLFGISLAGVAIQSGAGFVKSLRYALARAHHVFITVTLAFLAFAVAAEQLSIIEYKLEWSMGDAGLWIAFGIGLVISWLYLLVSIAIVTEFYRDMSKQNPE